MITGERAHEDAQVSNNPDIVAVSNRSLKAGRVRYVEGKGGLVEIEGSPDANPAFANTGSSMPAATRSRFKSCTAANRATPQLVPKTGKYPVFLPGPFG